MLQRIAGSIPFEAKIYWFWFVSKHHEGFANLPEDSEIKKMQKQDIGSWDFAKIREFMKFADIVGSVEAVNKVLNKNTQ
jgi:hypothetical protein